jgi:hypothetical protein
MGEFIQDMAKRVKKSMSVGLFLKSLGTAVMVISASANGESKVNEHYPVMPEPVTNNAVASVDTENGHYLLSFMGLGAAKTHEDVHNKVWALELEGESFAPSKAWQHKSPVPSSLPESGRLASIAVGVGDMAFLFGGYTVDAAHNEVSSPDNFRYDVVTDTYYPIAKTPVPVDDAVALVFQQRYVYLISGWHNDGNVNLVQIYDVKTDTWQQGSPFLGKPVFGHAGAIVGENIMLCDGVKVDAQPDKRRTFSAEPACYHGTIDKSDVKKIDWRTVAHPKSNARYRMAATGDVASNSAIFVGGSHNPYNYNGIGYDGEPSSPSNEVWRYDFKQSSWQVSHMDSPTMDHRGLLPVGIGENKHFVTLGGMTEQQKVSNAVHRINF